MNSHLRNYEQLVHLIRTHLWVVVGLSLRADPHVFIELLIGPPEPELAQALAHPDWTLRVTHLLPPLQSCYRFLR
jgi:hypothetical protein